MIDNNSPSLPHPALTTPHSKWCVYFAGGQRVKWALDEDLRWAEQALKDEIIVTSLAKARIVHSAWWPSTWVLGQRTLVGKHVVCFADNPPSLYARQPEFLLAAPWIGTWIARSRRALREFEILEHRAHYAPYCADANVFRPLDSGDFELSKLRRELGIPPDAYLVGNFHRDSEFVDGEVRPKYQKGADIFLEVVRRAHAINPRIHVLLAGPRRHWLRRRLQEEHIPSYFYGIPDSVGDDFTTNVVERSMLNTLYNLLDVCLISSRWEGGPHSVLEAAFSRTKVLSTPVGIAEDILEPASLFRTIEEGVTKLLQDAADNSLQLTIDAQFKRVKSENQLEHLRAALIDIYQQFLPMPMYRGLEYWAARSRIWISRLIQYLDKRPLILPKIIGFIGDETELALLREATEAHGITTIHNRVVARCRHYVVSGMDLHASLTKKLLNLQAPIVLSWGEGTINSTCATFLPSFTALTRLRRTHQHVKNPIVMYPIRSEYLPNLDESIVEALSTMPGDAVEIMLRTFAVAEYPFRVRWNGFR